MRVVSLGISVGASWAVRVMDKCGLGVSGREGVREWSDWGVLRQISVETRCKDDWGLGHRK